MGILLRRGGAAPEPGVGWRRAQAVAAGLGGYLKGRAAMRGIGHRSTLG
jgi:hypothetical protein